MAPSEWRECVPTSSGAAKYGCSHSQTLGSDNDDDVGYADGAEAMIGGKIVDGGGGIATLVAQTEEDVDARLEWAGYGRLKNGSGRRSRRGLSRVMIIWVVWRKCSVGASPGRRKSPTKNVKSVRGRNWTIRRWPVNFVYLQDRRQK